MASAASSSFSPPGSERQVPRSATRSCTRFCAAPAAGALGDPFGLFQKLPVIRPGGPFYRDREVRFEVFTRRANRMVLRITPTIPGSLDGAIDEVEPTREVRSELLGSVGRGREGEHLPDAVVADDGDKWLA